MSIKGQTINDRLNAAKYTLSGQSLARCVCKATTEELMRPKKKHLDYLAACTYESNISMLDLANTLIDRTDHSNWAVVYKALITVHHLMSCGSEKFIQYLASSNYSFKMSKNFDWIVAKGCSMAPFIKRYANYINQKALSYRTLAVDLCRAKKGEGNILRTMPIERLIETLPVIRNQLNVLLDFGCTSSNLSNSIIIASFTLLFHDAIRLFASYNDGIINLFEKYFDLNKKMCREAFEAYKDFLSCTDRVADFLKVAETIELNRGDLPDFKRAPSSLLEALEQHLLDLEGNRKRDKITIDTKLATLPSFTAKTSTYCTPPPLGTIATEFESQLTFSTNDSDFDSPTMTDLANNNNNINNNNDNNNAISSNNYQTELGTTSMSQNQHTLPTSLFDSKLDHVTPEPGGKVGQLDTKSLLESSFQVKNTAPASSNLFDVNPPGYSGGSLLTPQSSQSASVPITRSNQTMNRPQARPKSKQESIFEDLEQTMRKSLQKIEKT